MDFILADITNLLIEYRYIILFPALIVEGQVFTLLFASFLSSVAGGQVFNVYAVYFIALLADLTGDTIYYLVGRSGQRFLSEKRIISLNTYYAKHGAKTIVMGKLSHTLGVPAMLSAGTSRMAYPKFILVNLLVSIPKTLAIVLLGYFYGESSKLLGAYIGDFGMAISAIIVIVAIILFIRHRRSRQIQEHF